jgi:hypothetical protein
VLVSNTVSVTVCVTLDVTVERQMLSDETGRLALVELGDIAYELDGAVEAAVLRGAVAVYITELSLLSSEG